MNDTQFSPIRGLEENIKNIPYKDGQIITTETGNIYIDMPESIIANNPQGYNHKKNRIAIRGEAIPIVLTQAQYDQLRVGPICIDEENEDFLFFEDNRIYMIIQDDDKQ